MKKIVSKSWALILIIALSVMYEGCASKKQEQAKNQDTLQGLPLSDEATFSDIPVPQGFKLQRQQSYAFKDGELRIALLRYKSNEKLESTSWFYQDRMSQYQWEEIKIVDYEKNIQQYIKGGELCVVTIENVNEPFFGIFPIIKTQLTIQIIPLPDSYTKEPAEGTVDDYSTDKKAPVSTLK